MYRTRSEKMYVAHFFTVMSSAEKGRIETVENDRPSSSLFETEIILSAFRAKGNSSLGLSADPITSQ